jgi:hypothetical protein
VPATATITTFFYFNAGNKALSAEINANFSNLRGHFLPIDPTSSSASNANYDLGSDDHRWMTTYVKEIDLVSSTSTASLSIAGDIALTFGAFEFNIEGVEKFKITKDGFSGVKVSPTGYTSTALRNQFAVSSSFNISAPTTAASLVTGSTITISTSGRPVKFGITIPYSPLSAEDSTEFVGYVNTTTANNIFGIQYNIHPNTLGVYYLNTGVYRWAYFNSGFGGTASGNLLDNRIINNIFNGVLLLPEGTHTLCLSYRTSNIASCSYYGKFYAYEV